MSLEILETTAQEIKNLLEQILSHLQQTQSVLPSAPQSGLEQQRTHLIKNLEKAWLPVAKRWPNFKIRTVSINAFQRHTAVLKGEPKTAEIDRIYNLLSEKKFYNLNDLQSLLKASGDEAKAWTYLLQLSGRFVYEHGKGIKRQDLAKKIATEYKNKK